MKQRMITKFSNYDWMTGRSISMFFKFGNIYMGTSNNWKRNHGFPMTETKRYPHMRKDMPKHARIRYYAMKRAGCDMNFIKENLKLWNGFEWDERRKKNDC